MNGEVIYFESVMQPMIALPSQGL